MYCSAVTSASVNETRLMDAGRRPYALARKRAIQKNGRNPDAFRIHDKKRIRKGDDRCQRETADAKTNPTS